jgi:hypothetical protein
VEFLAGVDEAGQHGRSWLELTKGLEGRWSALEFLAGVDGRWTAA